MKVWRTDEELFTIIRQELFTCVVGDVMDKMGLQHQFLPPRIRPLRPDMVVIGGAVLNGYVRDTKAVLNMNFPAFCWGSYAQDSAPRHKVVDFRIPIEIGSARVRPGDFLFGDVDGVCVIPVEAATEAFTKALEKARGEKLVRKALEEGSSAVAAFEKHGIM